MIIDWQEFFQDFTQMKSHRNPFQSKIIVTSLWFVLLYPKAMLTYYLFICLFNYIFFTFKITPNISCQNRKYPNFHCVLTVHSVGQNNNITHPTSLREGGERI